MYKYLLLPIILSLSSLSCADDAKLAKRTSIGGCPDGYKLVFYINPDEGYKPIHTYFLMKDYFGLGATTDIIDSFTAEFYGASDTNVISYLSHGKDSSHLVSLYITPLPTHDTIISFARNDNSNFLFELQYSAYINKDSIALLSKSISRWNTKISIIKILPGNKWKEILAIKDIFNPRLVLDYSQFIFVENDSDFTSNNEGSGVLVYDIASDSVIAIENSGRNNKYAHRRTSDSPIILLKKYAGVHNFWKYISKDSLYPLTYYEYPLSVHNYFEFKSGSINYWLDDLEKNTRSNGIVLYDKDL